MSNEELYRAAVAAAERLHEDSSVSLSDTHSQLRALRDEIDLLVEAVKLDLRARCKNEFFY